MPSTLRDDTRIKLLDKCRGNHTIPTAIVWPCDDVSFLGAIYARDAGLIEPAFIAPSGKISELCDKHEVSIHPTCLYPAPTEEAAALTAIELVKEGSHVAIMKGSLHTSDLMRPLVKHLRKPDSRISHCFVIESPAYHKPLIVTDAAINVSPDFDALCHIIDNAAYLSEALSRRVPKIAILSATEEVTDKMSSTGLARALQEEYSLSPIGYVEGPMALDVAVSKEAARIKGIDSFVAGDADVLVCVNIEAANALAKCLTNLGGAVAGGVVLGAEVPVILTSRSDDYHTRLMSCAVTNLLVNARF